MTAETVQRCEWRTGMAVPMVTGRLGSASQGGPPEKRPAASGGGPHDLRPFPAQLLSVMERSGEQTVVLPTWHTFTRQVAVPWNRWPVVWRPSFGVFLTSLSLR